MSRFKDMYWLFIIILTSTLMLLMTLFIVSEGSVVVMSVEAREHPIVGNQRQVEYNILVGEAPVTRYVFIGDSRFVGMDNVVDMRDDFECIAKVGEGYRWLKSTALPKLDELINSNPNVDRWVLVLGLGVNDTDNIDNYIEAYKELSENYELYVLSVNPMGSKSISVTNLDVDRFNEKMSAEEWDRYIDSNTYLKSVGYDTVDGVHYTKDTYQVIYDYIVSQL